LVGRAVPGAPQGEVEEFVPQFDDDGNQTLIQTATGVWSVQYNGENRPVLWTGGTQSAATNIVMSFDRMGRRVEYLETAGGSQSSATETNAYHRFMYDNYLCIQRLDAANGNAVDLAFVWDVTEPIATRPLIVDKPEVCMACVTHDGNKNVIGLLPMSVELELVAHYRYDPFGCEKRSPRIFSDAVIDFYLLNPFRFSSEYYDDSLGLNYYINRHYNSVVGRWCSRDSIGEVFSEGLYLFVQNSGVVFFDVLGLVNASVEASREDCKFEIYAGHFHWVETRLKEIAQVYEKRATPPKCTWYGGVCCERDLALKQILHSFFLDEIPGMPSVSGSVFFLPMQEKEGGLDSALTALHKAYEAALAGAQRECLKENTCCKSVMIHFQCENEMRNVEGRVLSSKKQMKIWKELHPGIHPKRLCGTTKKIDCASEKQKYANQKTRRAK
jgi:RHS repeat-associated protein